MRIGIDAKWYFEGPPSGRVVVRNLVDNILIQNNSHEIFLFIDNNISNHGFTESSKLKIIPVWASNNMLSNLFLLRKIGNALNLDVLLFQNFTSLYTRFSRIAYIHDALYLEYPEYYGWKEKLYLKPLRFLSRRSEGIITISNSEKRRLEKYGFSKKQNIEVIYHGISEVFKPKSTYSSNILDETIKKYNLPNKFLLYVGRLNVRKNIENLLRGLAQTKTKVPIVIVGNYDNKMQDLTALIEGLGIKDLVMFLGFVPADDLPVVYSLATLFVFPSFAEGFGLPILEAMAAGVPVLTSNTTSLPEVGEDAAYYIDPSSSDEIAKGIDEIISNESLRNKMIEDGLNQAMKFRWEKTASNIISYCEKNKK